MHTAEGIAEGLKHGASQLLHGGKEEVQGFAQGIRESNESLPGNKNYPSANRTTTSSVKTSGLKGLGGVVEVGHELTGDASEDLPLAQEAAEAMGSRASGSAWSEVRQVGEKYTPGTPVMEGEGNKDRLREVGAEAIRVEHGGEAPWNKAMEMSQPVVEEGKSAVQMAKESLMHAKEATEDTLKAVFQRGEELGGSVAKEVGSLSGAAKAMDPEEPVPESVPRPTVPTDLKGTLQREYEAGQQEQMAQERMGEAKPRSVADSVMDAAESAKEQAGGVVGGVARQYGKATESVRMKAEEGAKEAHKQ